MQSKYTEGEGDTEEDKTKPKVDYLHSFHNLEISFRWIDNLLHLSFTLLLNDQEYVLKFLLKTLRNSND